MKPKKFKCCICNRMSEGFGNNPYPVKTKGRCCDECDNTEVLGMRLIAFFEEQRIRKLLQLSNIKALELKNKN